jgi:hypothetical protein
MKGIEEIFCEKSNFLILPSPSSLLKCLRGTAYNRDLPFYPRRVVSRRAAVLVCAFDRLPDAVRLVRQ